MPIQTSTRRLLASPFVDLLLGPHGVDRYLELLRPTLTVHDARARIAQVRRQTDRSVTLALEPNRAWSGFRAGQFARVGVEIDGVRHTRTYSPSSSARSHGRALELTVTVHPEGLVSRHLYENACRGMLLHLGSAQGEFALPEPRPQTLALISGGSGITPVLSMLRTLCDEGHRGRVVFVHYARTGADWLYESELGELAEIHPNLEVRYVATREGGGHLTEEALAGLLPGDELARAWAAVCGPPALIEATRAVWQRAQGHDERVLSETFTPPTLTVAGDGAEGTLRFLRSGRSVELGQGTLLAQAEAAGLTPAFGCRMGICHTCTCRKTAGATRNLLTGEVSRDEDEDIQLCVSVPAGDVALEL